MAESAAVIGAGFGGLCAAHRLQAAGIETTIVERAPIVGGKARNFSVRGHEIPGGPTVLTMREVFDELFADVGDRLEDHVSIRPLERLAHHRWGADETLDLYRDVERSADAVETFAGKAEADGYRRFVADAARIFGSIEQPFIRAPKPDLFGLVRAVGPLNARKIRPFDTMWSVLCQHFKDPRLRQLFGRYATYCGSSPFAASATLMLVAHVEQRGVFAVDGGTASLAKAISESFVALGGTIVTDADAYEIEVENRAVRGVALPGGRVEADAVIFAGDVSALGEGLFGKKVSRAGPVVGPRHRSLSAVTLCAAVRTKAPFDYHTVVFSPDYRAEFDALFGERHMPQEPTIYVCAPEPPSADGTQGVLMILNAPADGDRRAYGEEDVARCQNQAMATLERAGLSTEIVELAPTTPTDFAQMLPATGGAIYGRASHGWTASFQRTGQRTKIRGLYLAGGSVHPGPGAPMSALSGQMAAHCVMKDFGLMPQSRPAAISGGTSTA